MRARAGPGPTVRDTGCFRGLIARQPTVWLPPRPAPSLPLSLQGPRRAAHHEQVVRAALSSHFEVCLLSLAFVPLEATNREGESAGDRDSQPAV